jgi:hypothetical protein
VWRGLDLEACELQVAVLHRERQSTRWLIAVHCVMASRGHRFRLTPVPSVPVLVSALSVAACPGSLPGGP